MTVHTGPFVRRIGRGTGIDFGEYIPNPTGRGVGPGSSYRTRSAASSAGKKKKKTREQRMAGARMYSAKLAEQQGPPAPPPQMMQQGGGGPVDTMPPPPPSAALVNMPNGPGLQHATDMAARLAALGGVAHTNVGPGTTMAPAHYGWVKGGPKMVTPPELGSGAYGFLNPPDLALARSQTIPNDATNEQAQSVFNYPMDYFVFSDFQLAHQREAGERGDKVYAEMLSDDIAGSIGRRQNWPPAEGDDTVFERTTWDTRGVFMNMAMFPAIAMHPNTRRMFVRPYAAVYASFEPSAKSIAHIPSWTRITLPSSNDVINLDTTMLADVNSRKAVFAALNLTYPMPNSYVWIMPFDDATARSGIDEFSSNGPQGGAMPIGGASLGLALIAAVLNMPRVAYTGYVKKLLPDYRQMNPNNVDARAAMKAKFPSEMQPMFGRVGPYTLAGPMDLTRVGGGQMPDAGTEGWAVARVARTSDIVEEVDGLPFKCAWAIYTKTPLVIPFKSSMNQPLAEAMLNPRFKAQHFLLGLAPNAYTMVQAEEGLPYWRDASPVLIAVSVAEAAILAAYADLQYRVRGLGTTLPVFTGGPGSNVLQNTAERNLYHLQQRQAVKQHFLHIHGYEKKHGHPRGRAPSAASSAKSNKKKAEKAQKAYLTKNKLSRQNSSSRGAARNEAIIREASALLRETRGPTRARSNASSTKSKKSNKSSSTKLTKSALSAHTKSTGGGSRAASSRGASSVRSGSTIGSKASLGSRNNALMKKKAAAAKKAKAKKAKYQKKGGRGAYSAGRFGSEAGRSAHSSQRSAVSRESRLSALKRNAKAGLRHVGRGMSMRAKDLLVNAAIDSLMGPRPAGFRAYSTAKGPFKGERGKKSKSRTSSVASSRKSNKSRGSRASSAKSTTSSKKKKGKKGGKKAASSVRGVSKKTGKIKRKLNGYMLFCKGTRPIVVSQHPNAKQTDIVKQLGKMWRGLSQQQKDAYNKKGGGSSRNNSVASSQNNKSTGSRQYQSSQKSKWVLYSIGDLEALKEAIQQKPSLGGTKAKAAKTIKELNEQILLRGGAVAPAPKSRSRASSNASSSKKSRASSTGSKKSGYMLFSQLMRPGVVKRHPKASPQVIMKALGAGWRNLSQAKKDAYSAKARGGRGSSVASSSSKKKSNKKNRSMSRDSRASHHRSVSEAGSRSSSVVSKSKKKKKKRGRSASAAGGFEDEIAERMSKAISTPLPKNDDDDEDAPGSNTWRVPPPQKRDRSSSVVRFNENPRAGGSGGSSQYQRGQQFRRGRDETVREPSVLRRKQEAILEQQERAHSAASSQNDSLWGKIKAQLPDKKKMAMVAAGLLGIGALGHAASNPAVHTFLTNAVSKIGEVGVRGMAAYKLAEKMADNASNFVGPLSPTAVGPIGSRTPKGSDAVAGWMKKFGLTYADPTDKKIFKAATDKYYTRHQKFPDTPEELQSYMPGGAFRTLMALATGHEHEMTYIPTENV